MNSHRVKRTLKESMGYKVFAVFMAFTLCLPTTLTSNLTNMRQAQAATEAAQEYASADGGDSAATGTDSILDSSSGAAQGSSSENGTDSADPTDAGTSSGPADGANATVAGNGSTATDPSHNANASQQNNAATAQDESRKQALEKTEWTNQFYALKLTSKGLVVDPVALKDSLQQASSQSKATEAPSQSENAEGDQQAVQLPASIPASLDLSFVLDASKWNRADAGSGESAPAHDAVVPGDWFTQALPEGFAVQDEAAKLDVFQNDDGGNATTVKIATASWSNGKLKFEFCAPVDTVTGKPALDTEATAVEVNTEGATRTVLSASVSVPVSFDSQLAQDDESEIDWKLQQGAPDDRSVKLSIPSKATLAFMAGLANTLGGEGVPAAVSNAGDAAALVDSKTSLSSERGGKAEFTTVWADGNSAMRPSASQLMNNYEYRIYFQVEGDDKQYCLTQTDDAGNNVLSEDAKRLLGMTQEQFEALRDPGNDRIVQVRQTQTNTYSISANELYSQVITKTLLRDDEGNPALDEDKNPVYTKTAKNITWAIKHEGFNCDDVVYNNAYVVASRDRYPSYVTDTQEVLQLLGDVTFNLSLHVGDEANELAAMSDDERMEKWFEKWGVLSSIITQKVKNGVVVEELVQKGSEGKDGEFYKAITTGSLKLSISDDGKSGALGPARWPLYHPDGSTFVYSFKQDEEKHTTTIDNGDGTSSTYTDSYQVTYNNANTPNYGSDVSAAYNNGTVSVIHRGTTRVDFTKKWLDDDASARPDTNYTLWRYSAKDGEGPDTASQVTVREDGGAYISISLTAEQSRNAPDGTIDLGAFLRSKYKDVSTAKYDPAGYPYVYFLREDAPAGYERLFGSGVDAEDGAVTGDTAPNYYNDDFSGKVDATQDFVRAEGDKSVYSGGTIINRRSETTTPELTKTWDAASFQDQIADISVTFKLERILKKHARFDENLGYWVANGDSYTFTDPDTGETNEFPYIFSYCEDVPFGDQNKTVTGWTAENLTQTVSSQVPRFDANGEEWVYRWSESYVEKPDSFSFFAQDIDHTTGQSLMTGTFAVLSSITDASGEHVPLIFEGYYDKEKGVLVNKYIDQTTARAEKYWWSESSGEYTQDTSNLGYDAKPVSVTLTRNGNALHQFTLTGTAQDEPTKVTLDDGTVFFYQETTPWNMDFTGLPKYDENGAEYTYMVMEGSEGYVRQHEYHRNYKEDPDDSFADGVPNLTKIKNRPGEDASIVRVSKTWSDGGNTSARVPVRVGVFAAHDIEKDGQVVYTKDQKIGDTMLSEDNGWYSELPIGVGGLDQAKDVYIRELSVDDAQDADGNYLVLTRDEVASGAAGADYQQFLINWADTNPDNPWNERMVVSSNDNQGYAFDVSYGRNDSLNSLEVSNRRVGVVDVTANKTWTDQGSNPSNRPEASLVLSSSREGNVFHADENGDVYVNVGDSGVNEKRYVYTSSDLSSKTIYNVKTDSADVWLADKDDNRVDGDEGAKLCVRIDSTASDSQVQFATLPKCDLAGAVVDWTIEESWLEDSADYASSETDRTMSYDSKWHFADSIDVTYNNKRVETKDVTFFTKWYDGYVNEQVQQRPDVYLTVWRQVYEYDAQGNLVMDSNGYPKTTLEKVTIPDAYTWESIDDYNRKATIKNLPKYDSHGKEIVYYASFSTSVPGSSTANLDYGDPWYTFSANDEDPGNVKWDEASDEVAAAKRTEVVGEDEQGDTVDAIREDGTLNYRIANSYSAEGEKHWENMPYGFNDVDLPGISVYLQRRFANGSYDEAGAWQKGDPVAWSDLVITETEDGGYAVQRVDSTASAQGVADGKTAVAWTKKLTKNDQGYSYSLTQYGENGDGIEVSAENDLPKYDRNGHLYEYRAVEVIDGLANKPGGFTVNDLTSTSAGSAAGKVYQVYQGMPGSSLIANFYASEKGKLTVKKLYDGLDAGDKVPDTTFALYRYYITKDGTKSDAQPVATHTLSAGDIALSAGADGTTTGEGSYTFDNVDIYTPSGEYWVYYIVEDSVDGYGTLVAKGDKTFADTSDFTWGNFVGNGIASTDLEGPSLLDSGTFAQPSATAVANDTTPDVTFQNSYYPEDATVSLQGKKTWQDQSNAFGIRPENITLEVTRSYQDGTPDSQGEAAGLVGFALGALGLGSDASKGIIHLQSDDPAAANYLSWDKDSQTDAWVYTISNLEEYAPDGRPWRYTVKEIPDTNSKYLVSANGGTVNADNHESDAPVPVPPIVNYLDTELTVSKVWKDNEDLDWKQRPDVTVALQAKVDDGEWGEAGAVLKDQLGIVDGEGNALASFMYKGSAQAFEQTWSAKEPDNQGKSEYSYTWKQLPAQAKTEDGTIHTLAWRAVEKKLVYNAGSSNEKVVEVASPDNDGTYGSYYPYQPSQTSSLNVNGQGVTECISTITNTLDATAITAKKTWIDNDNEWVTRPGTNAAGDGWSVTYAVQRSTTSGDNNSWKWLSEYGADIASPFANNEGELASSLLKATISGTGADATATFKNLPKTDVDGKEYTYRLVEKVVGSYKAEGTLVASSADGKVHLVAVGGANAPGVPGQTFTNTLNTVDVSGTKRFNDYGTGLAPTTLDQVQSSVKLKVQHSLDGLAWSDAEKDGGTAPQAEWAMGENGAWTFKFSSLPYADQAGNVYQYRVVEVSDGASGFFDSYADDASVDKATGDVTTATITNTATRFTMDKIGDKSTGSDGERLNGVVFELVRDGKTFASWQRDEQGVVSSTVWHDGRASGSTDPGVAMTGDNQGFLVGLPAGTYTVKETKTPAGHVQAADFQILVSADGAVTLRSGGKYAQASAGPDGVVCVSVTDAVTRGKVVLHKFYDHGSNKAAVANMTFDLYKKGAYDDNAANGGGILIATGITTGDDGTWCSSEDEMMSYQNVNEAFGEFAKYYRHASDGLPLGNYYFVETSTSSNTVDALGRVFSFQVEDNKTSQPNVKVEAENDEFNASAQLKKTNSETGEPVSGAKFALKRDNGTFSGELIASDLRSGTEYAFDATASKVEASKATDAGVLKLTGLKKGSYILTEIANTGYDLSGTAPINFTVTNEDNGKALLLGTGGELANTPLHGSINLVKVDASDNRQGVDGAQFTLQKKGADGQWADVAYGLLTGKSYRAAVDAVGLITTVSEADAASGVASKAGELSVENLPWGIYRFVESKAADGYVGKVDGSWPISNEMEIKADNVQASSTVPLHAGQIANSQTDLVIWKTDKDGSVPLKDAEFTIVPNEGSSFVDGSASKAFVTDTTGKALPIDGSSSLAGQLIVGNSYTITETKATNGYSLPSPASIVITIGDDGAARIVTESATGNWEIQTSGSVSNVLVKDDATSVIFYKQDENGKPLAGSEFKMKGAFSDGSTEKTVALDGDMAKFVASGLLIVGETYSIEEAKAPAGYEKLPAVQFKVTDAGTVEAVGTVPAGWTIADGGAVVVAKDTPIEVFLNKKSTSGIDVANATYQISGKFRGADGQPQQDVRIYTTATTQALKGAVKVEGLIGGETYTIKETASPAGYVLDGTEFTFTVKDDGTVVAGSSDQTRANGAATTSQDSYRSTGYSIANRDTVTITQTDAPVRLGLAKRGSDTGEQQLSGAEFTIEGKFAKDYTSGVAEQKTYQRMSVNEISSLRFVAGETYSITETKAPDGYELIQGAFTFTVSEDGKVYEGGANHQDISNGQYLLYGDYLGFVAVDNPIEVTLSKYGSDKGDNSADSAISGATFRIKGVFADSAEAGETERVFTMDAGSYSLPGLIAGNTYQLWEASSPAGYKQIKGALSFMVNADGTIDQVNAEGTSFENGTMGIEDGKVSIEAVDDPVELTIVKKDESGQNALSGAVFGVTPVGGSAFADGTTGEKTLAATDGDGKTSLSGQLVVGGKYEISELVAPAGYKRVGQKLTVQVASDGQLKAVGSVPAAFKSEKTGSGSAAITVFTGDVWNSPTKMYIQKSSAIDGLWRLPGATYQLTGVFADGSNQRTLTTDKNGMAEVDRALLIADGATEYTLKETVAPEGYALNAADFVFTVSTDGSIVAKGEAVAGFAVTGEGNITVSATDDPIEVAIKKAASDGAGDSAMNGAEFRIEGVFADETESKVETLTTYGDGFTEVLSSMLKAGQEYTITETKAPAGYKLLSNALKIKVSNDGSVTVVGEVPAGWEIDDRSDSENGAVLIVATDDPVSMTVAKQAEGADASAMQGAGFSVTPAEGSIFADGTTGAKTLVTGADGKTSLDAQLVVGGTYTLEEEKAPAGYKLIEGVLSFTVNGDGTLAVAGQAPEGFAVTAAGGVAAVTVTDTLTEVSLSKVDIDSNEALGGAEFTLEGAFSDGQGGSVERVGSDAAKVIVGADGKLTVSGGSAVADGEGLDAIRGLVAGEKYTLTETRAPEGYELNTQPFVFTMGNDGAVVPAGEAWGWSVEGGSASIVAADKAIEFRILKQGRAIGGEGVESADPGFMAGAEFAVTGVFAGSTEESTDVMTVGTDGWTEGWSSLLVAGNIYTISETRAPLGYKLIAEPLNVMVKADGTLVVVDAEGNALDADAGAQGWSVLEDAEGIAQITAVDEPTSVMLSKVSAEGGQALAGAEFDLEGSFAQGFGQMTPGKKRIVVDGQGNLRIADIEAQILGGETAGEFSQASSMEGLVAGESYLLTEVKAPAGYELVQDTLRFAVNDDGTVCLVQRSIVPEAWTLSNDQGEIGITCADVPLKVSLSKQNKQGAALEGAQFTLSGAFPDGSATKTFTSNGDGVAFKDMQLIGSSEGDKYVLTETQAPDGYVAIDPVTLVVYADGTVKLDGDSLGASSKVTIENGEDGTAYISVTDDAAPIPDGQDGSDSFLSKTGDWTFLQAILAATVAVGAGFAATVSRRRGARARRAERE